ncbi:hypothetical protein BDK51DRAFT_10402, partial [Blyttiomyces helicus]
MNGNWNPWGQKPRHYVAFWKSVYNAVQAVPGAAGKVSFVWAPNISGGGYPWGGLGTAPFVNNGTDTPKTAANALNADEFTALDTNGDQILDAADDPYLPYWPGPQYVHWIGAS